MNVMLVSQCSKRALQETRRILDQFAERKGERTWQTAITMQGLTTLRKMLRKTAKRNTAIACHWIKAANRTELLWIVGNAGKFNEQGTVPTNTTQGDILRTKDENLWHTIEDISILAGITGLFHDFGKANKLFQNKLKPSHKGKTSEPFRHEWISLRIFQSFVGQLTDQQWLQKLSAVNGFDEQEFQGTFLNDGLNQSANPFGPLPPLARIVGWLIVSHHRLPKWQDKEDGANAPRLSKIDGWLTSNKFGPDWNSPQCRDKEWTAPEMANVWRFPAGFPLLSKTWQAKAHSLATRALKRPKLLAADTNWMVETFLMHLARLALMLSDHYYSAHDVTPHWQDSTYKAYANTDRATKSLKQKLDEHLVGVGHNAVLLSKGLSSLRPSLPAITRHKGFKKRSEDPRFRWQDKAYELACGIRERADAHGFFGVNMASTGCGKTFANGRIMYGLANEKTGCRFSVALGLRTLTLQTGDALRTRLRLDDDDLAVLIGSQAVRDLHEFNYENEKLLGSESAEDFFAEDQHVRYEGTLADGRLSRWLAATPKLHRLVSAPILVSTIDHLMPATEGERGGKQIAPILRLLTADLVLDEPDDFDLADLPALCRLVNWAGMFGSRIVISSATLPPSLIQALFDAYLAGRREFQKNCGEPGRPLNVCCAWFDEKNVAQSDHSAIDSFAETHNQFVQKRITHLAKAMSQRLAELLPISVPEPTPQGVVQAMADIVHTAMHDLHARHHQLHPESGKRISIGLVRMANINPLVAVAKELFAKSPRTNHRLHFCVYHSQHPLAVRSDMEKQLDHTLTRHDPQALWQQPEIRQALIEQNETDHLFVVLATSVAEVGRDHDYDWAIAEPSSMRSLIQLAGRIQRHRNLNPTSPNLYILARNYRALIGKSIAFEKPGFESSLFPLDSHDLHDLLQEVQYRSINSIPRITEHNPLIARSNLVDLEHAHLAARLFGSANPEIKESADLWWRHAAHWSFELQRRSPFRKSAPDSEYVFHIVEEDEPPRFHLVDGRGGLKRCESKFELVNLEIAAGISLWGENDMGEIAAQLSESMEMQIDQVTRKFGVMRLPQSEAQWLYHSALGVHRELG
jgi:CRISPR-associated endonuclease/helicase Cas3